MDKDTQQSVFLCIMADVGIAYQRKVFGALGPNLLEFLCFREKNTEISEEAETFEEMVMFLSDHCRSLWTVGSPWQGYKCRDMEESCEGEMFIVGKIGALINEG